MTKSSGVLALALLVLVAASAIMTGCDDKNDPASPASILSFDEVFDWACESGDNCQDVFDMELTAGSIMTFQATETTGGSVLQVALYGPDEPLGGTNLFTGDTSELRCNYVSGCSNNTAGQMVNDFVVPADGTYRFAVTRDWGASCGGSGTYRLIIDSDTGFPGVTQTVDDEPSLATDWSCPGIIFGYDEVLGWDCDSGVDCQDVFDMELTTGSIVTFQATETTGGSVLQVALYGPGVPLGGTNLFTGNTDELRCNFVNGCNSNTEGQTVNDFVVPGDGLYRFAVTRDWGNSCGGSGTYRLVIDSDTGFPGVEQSVDDEPSLATDWTCPILDYDEVLGWDCGSGIDCQDVFDMELTTGSIVTFAATEVTGGSVLQVALYGPGVPLGGTNLFTGNSNELRCNYVSGCNNNTAGQTVNDFVVPGDGLYRFAVTRDWGHSCGGSGTYRLTVASDTGFPGVEQTVDDEPSLAPDWECP
jgi:hypothetical protein